MFAFLLLTCLLKVVTFYSRDVTFNLNSNIKETTTYLHLHEHMENSRHNLQKNIHEIGT